MSDDIVTRLREELLGFHQHLSQWEINAERNEAADEIEHLRAELALWKKVAKERNPRSWVNLVRKKYGMEDMYDR